MKFSEELTKEIICPNCKSDNCGNTKRAKSSFGILMVLFGIPYLKYRNEFYCYDCENIFESN